MRSYPLPTWLMDIICMASAIGIAWVLCWSSEREYKEDDDVTR